MNHLTPVTDPDILSQLEGAGPVTDPEILRQLEQEDQPIGAFLNQRIAQVLGAPVDLMSGGLSMLGLPSDEPWGGSLNIARGMRAIGVDVAPMEAQPRGLGQRVEAGVGEAVGAMLPFGGVARGVSATKGVAGTIAREMMETTARQPVRAGAFELAAGAGAGTGGYIAERTAPGSVFAETMGELGGGVAVPIAIQALTLTPLQLAIRAGKAATAPFTEAGGMRRAGRRLRGLTADPEAEALRVAEPTIAKLTPAQKTGNRRMMALERAILKEDAALEGQFAEQTAQASRDLRDVLKGIGKNVSLAKAIGTIRQRRDYILGLLEQRARQAVAKAEQRLSKMAPKLRDSESQRLVREELEKAVRDARVQESKLWDAVPKETPSLTENGRRGFADIVADTPVAQQEDIPDIALKMLDPESNRFIGTESTIKEVQGLRSKLLEEARKARSAGESNKARIADMLAEGLRADMNAGAAGPELEAARNISSAFNDTFKQGNVGRLLGYAKEGGARIAPELTVETSIGRAGTRGMVATDELLAAADTPALREGVQDYLKNRFILTVAPEGVVNPRAARKFVQNNLELLDRFPGLKSDMMDVKKAQDMAERVGRSTARLTKALTTPSMSRTAEILGAAPDKVIDAAIKSKNPLDMAREMRRQVSGDANALEGLKTGVVDYLILKSTAGRGELGEALLSGRAMREMITTDPRTRAVVRTLLSSSDMSRLKRVVRELEKLELTRGRLPSIGAPMQDIPGQTLSIITRVLAAQHGRVVAGKLGGGTVQTPGIFADRAKAMLGNLTNDKARELLGKAIQDDKLFRLLLRDITTQAGQKSVNRRLNAWLASPANTVFDELRERSP